MQTKNFGAAVKAAGPDGGLSEGQFEAIVSVFDNVDTFGDVVLPGAFKNDLERWAASGDPLPVLWSHEWNDPFAHLGTVLAAEERPEGLWIRGQIEDLDTNEKAAQVYRLLKGRRVRQFSFAYDVLDSGWGKRDEHEVLELRELKVHEVGPCLLGVNQETELLAVKARNLADLKAGGATLDTRALAEARDVIDLLLTGKSEPEQQPQDTPDDEPDGERSEAPADDQTDDEPSQDDGPATTDEQPDGAASAEPSPSAPRRALTAETHQHALRLKGA